MADHGKDGRQIAAAHRLRQCGPQRVAAAGEQHIKQPLADEHRRHAFAHIPQRGARRSGLAEGAQHIGHAAVAAAMIAHIIVEKHLGDDHAEQNAAQQIPLQRRQHAGTEQTENHTNAPFSQRAEPSPCSRVIMRMGVPVRPKVSRIWFSR